MAKYIPLEIYLGNDRTEGGIAVDDVRNDGKVVLLSRLGLGVLQQQRLELRYIGLEYGQINVVVVQHRTIVEQLKHHRS